MQHIAQNGGLKACRIGIYQKEEGRVGEQKGTALQEGKDTFFDFPDFPLGSSSVRRRIHDNGVVVIAPADLPLDKFSAVVHKPADVSFAKTGQLRIFPGPAHHAFGGIHMCDCCPCRSGCRSGSAGIGEEVENTDIVT